MQDSVRFSQESKLKRLKPYLFLLIYFFALNYLVLHTPFSLFTINHIQPINKAALSSEGLTAPPGASSYGQRVDLPDDWYHSGRDQSQYWYQQTVVLKPDRADMWAVYLPFVTHNAAVYINGMWIGQGGQFEAPVARNHNQPLLFPFSSQLLKAGENTITFRVAAASPRQGLMDQFYVEPYDLVYGAYRWKSFVRVDLIEWFTIIMFVMAFVLFCFWLVRPQDKTYGLFALLLAIWATHNLNLFVIHIPTSSHFWEALTMSTLGWTVVTLIFFNHLYVGYANKKVERFMLVYAIFGLGIFLLPDIETILVWGYGLWDFFLIIFGSYAIIHLLRAYWIERDGDMFLMLLVGLPILVFGFHDILTVNNLRDRREGLTIQYSVIPAASLFSFFLIRRFVQSLDQAEQLADTLELRVQAREKELKTQFEKLTHLEQERVLSEERERIMRDMHDGIGGQLVAVVSELNDQQDPLASRIKQRVQNSLTDLRFVIDSLDPVLNDLSTLLGMMRARLEQQLDGAQIKLKWDVSDLPEMVEMSPKRSLHIMRIIQEAVTNAIKHSGASELRVSTHAGEHGSSYVIIDIQDNGQGMSQDLESIGQRGIKNMRYRAEQVDGEIEIRSSDKRVDAKSEAEQGTSVRLILRVAEL